MYFKDLDKDLSKELFFEEAYNRYSGKVYFFVYSYIKDGVQADDIVQDVYMALWEKIDSLNDSGEIYPYLLVMAKYRCLNFLRHEKYQKKYSKEKKLNASDISIIALRNSSLGNLYSKEVEKLYASAIELMPPKVRETFLFSRKQLLKNREVAQLQNISEKTVEYRISCAYKILRKVMGDYFLLIVLMLPYVEL
ncbi:MAG: RNA polymerase sigma-70 factor [Bacteroidales bacterium]|nr:RNA polymerase sigma-70 factor [Bacteroidales bacterium]